MEENVKRKYLSFLSEIIHLHSIVLGPQIAVMAAKKINGLSMDKAGNAIGIKGDVLESARKLLSAYEELAGECARELAHSVALKYPTLKL